MSERQRRAVIVDDEEGVLKLCDRLLRADGFATATFRQPHQALEYLKKHPADVLVVDARLPEMDGFTLLAHARLHQPGLAVVVTSGFATVETALKALNYGADGMVLKPFEHRQELADAVRRAIAHRRQQEETARLAALQPLFDVVEALLSETRLAPLQELVISQVDEMLPNTAAGLYLWEGDQTSGKVLAGHGNIPPADDALWQRLTARSADAPATQPAPAESDLLQRYGWYDVLVATVPRGQRTYGLLVAREQPPLFHRAVDGTVLGILARLAAAALENAHLYEDLRHSLEQLEHSQHALAQAEKMAAIGRLTASLAHEVNNPIQAVRNSLYLVDHPSVSEEKRARYIQTARQEIERLADLVHRMLNFYRPGNAERRLLALPPLIDHLINLLEDELRQRHIEIVVEVPDDLPPILGVESQLQQVLLNLILNAAEAMLEGGRLYILGWQEGEHVVVAVEDTGPGIPPEIQERIFEPLVSTKPEGTGLGLAVSYNIITAHGGEIALVSPRRGTGAAFQIRLPISKPPSAQKGGTSESPR